MTPQDELLLVGLGIAIVVWVVCSLFDPWDKEEW